MGPDPLPPKPPILLGLSTILVDLKVQVVFGGQRTGILDNTDKAGLIDHLALKNPGIKNTR